MTDLAAAPDLLTFRRRSTLDTLRLDPALEIGAGGEAVVYGLGDPALVAKVYHAPGMDHARKLSLMLARPPALPQGTAIAWPCDLLLAPGGGFAGFLMPRAEGPRIFELYNPVSRRQRAPGFHYGLLHRAGANLAAAFAALHQAGYVVGDVNESNVILSPAGGVTLVDTDSMQVTDASSGRVHRSRVGKPEFTPPELQGVAFGEVDRAPVHDAFGLGVLLFLLLMEGTHPFALRLAADAEVPPVEERIARGLFAFAGLHPECRPPRLAPRFQSLHPALAEMFTRCFVHGHADRAARPAPAEWRDALARAQDELATCARNPQHRHAPHLDACPWCARRELLGGRDPFPPPESMGGLLEPSVAAALWNQARPRPPRPRAPSAVAAAPAAPVPSRRPVNIAPAQPMSLAVAQDGLREPAVWVLPALLLALGAHGGLQAAAAVGLMVAVVRLVQRGLGRLTTTTLTLSFALTAAIAAMLSLMSSGSVYMPADGFDKPGRTAVAPYVPEPGDDASPPAGSQSYAGAEDELPSIYSDLHDDPGADWGDPNEAYSHAGGLGAAYRLGQVDRRPLLTNPEVAKAAMAHALTDVMRARHVRGTATLWLRVRDDGLVDPWVTGIVGASNDDLTLAARQVALVLRYEPALKNGVPVAVWVAQPLDFGT